MAKPGPELEYPILETSEIPTEDVIKQATQRFNQVQKAFKSHTWFRIKVKENLPIGICWFGDPHLDADGCNWPVLQRDIDLCRSTPGLYGANVGDTTNNWAGRLVRLYAEQNCSNPQARQLAKWFMLEAGINWILWLLGNHDLWGDGAAVLQLMAQQYGTTGMVLHDWEARFVLEFPNGWEIKIYVAHNFKGTSIYNVMHGPMREGLMGEDADLYVCGDKHTSGMFSWENPARNHTQDFLRVRGYKFFDSYTRHLGFKEQASGCAGVTVLDPAKQALTTFLDAEEGALFLRMKRK